MSLRPRIVPAGSLALAVAFAGCGGAASPTTPGPGTEGQVVQSQKVRVTDPTVPASDAAALVAGNTDFAFALHQQLVASAGTGASGNLIYSPYSISIALAMTWGGAETTTQSQMATALHYTLSEAQLHPAFDSLDLALASRGQGATGDDGTPFKLTIANAVWGQTGWNILPSYLDLIAENYGAGVRLVDFMASPDAARTTINQWVSDETNAKITNLLAPGTVTSDTRMVLTNAVYFNAGWASTFDTKQTANATFTNLDGTTASVATMHQAAEFAATQQSGYTAVQLPYSGDQLSMILVVPDAGNFAAFEGTLSSDTWAGIASKLSTAEVNLSLPKWTVDSGFSLASTLSAMGMPVAFTAAADFSGIDGLTDLFISDVIHKGHIAVDESGTEAAAATAVVVTGNAVLQNQITLDVDRPFLYAIRDDATGTILFVGRVVDLAQ